MVFSCFCVWADRLKAPKKKVIIKKVMKSRLQTSYMLQSTQNQKKDHKRLSFGLYASCTVRSSAPSSTSLNLQSMINVVCPPPPLGRFRTTLKCTPIAFLKFFWFSEEYPFSSHHFVYSWYAAAVRSSDPSSFSSHASMNCPIRSESSL